MNKRVWIYIIVAYLFSLLSRYLLYFLAKSHPEFIYGGHVIALWTADAGLYGSYAKQLLSGHHLMLNSETAPGFLIYWVVRLTHLDIETVMFVLPAFLASLIVVPIILIMKEFQKPEIGFWAALAASIGMNYYFRTHMGYTDTDMLNFVLFFFILWALIALAVRRMIWYGVAAALLGTLFMLWYHSAKPLLFGLWGFFVLYLLIFDRKNVPALLGGVLLLIPLLPISFGLQVAAIVILGVAFWIIERRWQIDYRYLLGLFLVVAIAGGVYGYKHGALDRALHYIHKAQEYRLQDRSQHTIELSTTLKTVAEARGITPSQLFTYSAGNIGIFLLGVGGLLLLTWRKKEAVLLWLPLIIGIASLKAGVRFTTFAVPVLSIGFVYLFYELSLKVRHSLLAKGVFYLPALGLVLYYLYILDTYNHMLSPFFKRGELADIHKQLNTPQKGYILTWWDYGWPLWYYTNKRTLIDNGKHQYDNYIVAKTLFAFDQDFVARFDRFFVETYDRIYPWAVLPYVLKKYDFVTLIRGLYNGTLELPPKKNEIYYYFDDKILDKLPVIESFSRLKGERPKGFVWVDRLRVLDGKRGILQGSALSINLRTGELRANQGKDVIGTLYLHDGKRVTHALRYRKNDYSVIVYKNRYIIGLYRYINSFFAQAFFFNNLDKNLFETLAYDEDAKIFHLR